MNTRSLKFRLVVWYAGWLGVLFIVFGVFVYASLDYYLERSLREALLRRARLVADVVQRSPLDEAGLASEIRSYFAPEVNNRFTRATRHGAVIYVSGRPTDQSFDPAQVPPPPVSSEDESYGHRTLPDGNEMLVAVVSRASQGGRLTIEEGAALAPLHATLQAWVMALVMGLALLILLAVVGGAVLVQRALQPVDRITRSAERISSRNLSERLPVPASRDEIERLSTALNAMIRRLDEGFQQTQRFFADASHELRTPLTIIQGELEAVLKNQDADPGSREAAGSALEEVERLKNIVESLFALSRLDAGEGQMKFEAVDLAELAASTTDQMCLLAEDRRIVLACPNEGPVVTHADRSRLKQVLVNLIDNAIKFTPEGGRVEVRVSRRGDQAVLTVSDNGPGIPPEALPRIFERFFRVDKARSRELGGAGLGLAIVKSICTAHQGTIDVRSDEGRGSTFTVVLPGTSPLKA